MVISFAEINASEQITRTARQLCKDIPLIVRTRDDRHLERLLECGADEVIPDTIESSIMLAQHTLSRLNLDQTTIDEMLTEAREGHYARVRAFFHSADDVDLNTPDHHHLHSIEILHNYHAEGQTIESLKCLPKINVIALKRNGLRSEGPLLDIALKAGDVLIIEGTPDDIRCAEIEVMSGL